MKPDTKSKPVGWVISGYLSDKTMLFGPLKAPPSQKLIGKNEGYTEVQVDGEPWYVLHSGHTIAANMKAELEAWVRKMKPRK